MDRWPLVANPPDNAADLRKQHLRLNGSGEQMGGQNPQEVAEK